MPKDILWAPWRLQYIKSAKDENAAGCFICCYAEQNSDEENFVVARSTKSIAILNRFPYNNGHLLVAPAAHKGDLEDLDDEELLDCMRMLRRMKRVIDHCLKPQGFNIGLNLGRVAGAGLPGHLHWHIVPRWSGDTNFMTVLADATVIPQSLKALYDLLQKELAASGDY